jgi:hypothetical protein
MAVTEWVERASFVRYRTLGRLSVAVWDEDSQCAELVLACGIFRETMGFSKGGRDWLYGEEALFLLEQGGMLSEIDSALQLYRSPQEPVLYVSTLFPSVM